MFVALTLRPGWTRACTAWRQVRHALARARACTHASTPRDPVPRGPALTDIDISTPHSNRQDAYMHYLFGVMEDGAWGAIDTRDVSACACMGRARASHGRHGSPCGAPCMREAQVGGASDTGGLHARVSAVRHLGSSMCDTRSCHACGHRRARRCCLCHGCRRRTACGWASCTRQARRGAVGLPSRSRAPLQAPAACWLRS